MGLSMVEECTSAPELIASRRFMLLSEGITWMVLLLLGGVTLIYFILRLDKKNNETKNFVASYSHDLKTSLTSLRLQAESLAEDITDENSQTLIKRLVGDSQRLQLQLENSLQFSGQKRMTLLEEHISFSELLQSLSYYWPDVKLDYEGRGFWLLGDKRALDIIFRNLIYNAINHGKASQVEFKVSEGEKGSFVLQVSNNGQAFVGDISRLGELYFRHNPSSGSGLGLHITKELMQHMGGNLSFDIKKDGPFTVVLSFRSGRWL